MKKLWFVLTLVSILLTGTMASAALAEGPAEGRVGRAEVRFLEGMIDHHQMALDMANECLAKGSTESVLTLCQSIIDAQSAEIETMQGWLLSWYNIDYSPMSMNSMMGMGMSDETRTQMEEMHGMMNMMMGMDMSDEMRGHMEQMRGMMDMMSGMSATQESGMSMANMPVSDPPMMMGMMAGLNRLEGVDYEIAFLESMIDHHDDAIHMSQRLLQNDPEGTGHDELRAQAQKIIDDQTAEIDAMEQLITQLSA